MTATDYHRQPLQPAYGFVHVRSAPVTFAFSSVIYTVTEGDAATITVTRTGTGAASVDYATTPGTAAETGDYLPASGTLTWAEGETGSKTFTVQTVENAVIEGPETALLSLSNPVGARLDVIANAVLLISDDDVAPAGGYCDGALFCDTFTRADSTTIQGSTPDVGSVWLPETNTNLQPDIDVAPRAIVLGGSLVIRSQLLAGEAATGNGASRKFLFLPNATPMALLGSNAQLNVRTEMNLSIVNPRPEHVQGVDQSRIFITRILVRLFAFDPLSPPANYQQAIALPGMDSAVCEFRWGFTGVGGTDGLNIYTSNGTLLGRDAYSYTQYGGGVHTLAFRISGLNGTFNGQFELNGQTPGVGTVFTQLDPSNFDTSKRIGFQLLYDNQNGVNLSNAHRQFVNIQRLKISNLL